MIQIDMEMPKNCKFCPLHDVNPDQCPIRTIYKDDYATSRFTDCPLYKIAEDTDTISRQAAIDIERNATVDTNPSHFVAHQKFTQFLDDAEISSFGRWQWSNGFNTALTAVGIDLKKLPSAQPEIVLCKDCKYWNDEFAKDKSTCWLPCMSMTTHRKWYCGSAERRTDG